MASADSPKNPQINDDNRSAPSTGAILIRRKHYRPTATGSYEYKADRISIGNIGDNNGGFSEPEGADDGLVSSPPQTPPAPLNSVVVGSDAFITSLAASDAPSQAIKRLLEDAQMDQQSTNRNRQSKDILLSSVKTEPDNFQPQYGNPPQSTYFTDGKIPPTSVSQSGDIPPSPYLVGLNRRSNFPIPSQSRSPFLAGGLNPVYQNGRAFSVGVSISTPSSSNSLIRIPASVDYSFRSPSTSVASFVPLALCNMDPTANPLLRLPPPSVAPITSIVTSIPMPGMVATSTSRGPLTYSMSPTATSTTTSTTGRYTVLMPRQQPSLLPTPINHANTSQISPLLTSSSILKRLKAKAKSEMSSVLRLDPAVVLDRGAQAQPQNVICRSRTGFHVCHYCQRIFSSPSLYANHLNRPVARILYRCHLCPSTSDAVVPVLQRASSVESGNLSAPNLCALYAHMAQCHAHEPPSTWKLVPSRLSVTALPWLTGDLEGLKRLPSSIHQTIYSEGQELVDLANDIDRRLTNMLRSGEFHFLPQESRDNESTFLLEPDIRFTSMLSSQFTPTPETMPASALSKDGLPTSLSSPISHLLFRLAEASPWHGHFFLTGWYPSIRPLDTQEASVTPPQAASFEEIQQAYEVLLRDSQHSTSTSPSSFASSFNGSLRCMLCCGFRTNSSAALRNHLTGYRHGTDIAPAKCALCSLSVVHNRRDTLHCSIKAHLLFHLDIYLVCPQCGFTPLPDLPSPLAEACLRLHLRFVCFHFNLLRVLLCSKSSSACRDRIFLSMENFVQHWFETHTVRKYACQLCGSSGPQGKMEENIGNESPSDSAARPSGFLYEFQDMATVCSHIQERHSLSSTSAPTFSMVAYECSECSFISSLPVDFADHFSSTHCRLAETGGTNSSTRASQSRQSPCECRCFYRCFGECRRILPTLDGLRAHMRTCVYALAALKQAFGDLLFNSCADKQTLEGLASNSASDSTNVSENPLCRCLYCDVSTKNDVSFSRKDDSETQSTSSNAPSQPTTYQSARAFSDLQQLHEHEHSVHVTGGAVAAVASSSNGGQVGCPWCAEKLALKTTGSEGSIADGLLKHLRAHAMTNPYVAWQMARMQRFNENRDEVVTCHCRTGWLDSPLTLMAHATALPTSANTFRRSSQSHEFGDVALLPFPSLFAVPLNSPSGRATATTPEVEILSKSSISTTTQTMATGFEEDERNISVNIGGKPLETTGITTVKFLYQPGGHPPLSKEVYGHLRFGQYYDLDERLKAFNDALVSDDDVTVAAKGAFMCPICSFHGGSRWALTEHAFFSHWLRLCYICCEYIHDESARNINSKEKSIWSHIYSCLNHRHMAILSSKSNEDALNADLNSQIQRIQQTHRHFGKKRRLSTLRDQTEGLTAGSAEVLSSSSTHLPTSSPAVEENSAEFDSNRFIDPPSVYVQSMDMEETTKPLAFRLGFPSDATDAVAGVPPPSQHHPVVGGGNSSRKSCRPSTSIPNTTIT